MQQYTTIHLQADDRARVANRRPPRVMGADFPGLLYPAYVQVGVGHHLSLFVESAAAAESLIDALTAARDYLASIENCAHESLSVGAETGVRWCESCNAEVIEADPASRPRRRVVPS